MAGDSCYDQGSCIAGRWNDNTSDLSVTSAVEGLRQIPYLNTISTKDILIIVIVILTILFFLQQFGTASIGRLFGPMMSVWFVMLAVMGSLHLLDDLAVFKAFSPHYAINLLRSGHGQELLDTWCISLHNGCRGFIFRSWPLRQMEHPLLLDICKTCLILITLARGLAASQSFRPAYHRRND